MYIRGPVASGSQAVNTALEVLISAESVLVPFLHHPWVDSDILVQENDDDDDDEARQGAARLSPYTRQALLNQGSVKVAPPLLVKDEKTLLTRQEEENSPTTTTMLMSQSVVDMVVKKSLESISSCEAFETRLEMHRESAELGAVHGVQHWARMLMFGFEVPTSQCGYSSLSNFVQRDTKKRHAAVREDPSDVAASAASSGSDNVNAAEWSIENVHSSMRDIAAAVVGFTRAADQGHVQSIVPLAFTLLHGIGLEALLHFDRKLSSDWDVPETNQAFYGRHAPKQRDQLRVAMGSFLARSLQSCVNRTVQEGSDAFLSTSSLAQSVLCSAHFNEGYSSANLEDNSVNAKSVDVSDLALGLLFIAALHNDAEAQVALAYR
jgi:TPR repeat protein